MRGPRSTVEQVIERAYATAVETRDGCLLVTEWKPMTKGYVRAARVDERGRQMIHRLVVEAIIGRRLAVDETVDHVCHNDSDCAGGPTCIHRRCILASHLDVTDAVTNWSRGSQGVVRQRREKTHCPYGHPYEERNLRASAAGHRGCKACSRAGAAGRDRASEPTYL